MRIATLRYAYVAPEDATVDSLNNRFGSWKNLWGWVGALDTAKVTLAAITADEGAFPLGHERFNVVGPTIHGQCDAWELLGTRWPKLQAMQGSEKWKGTNGGFWDVSKAEKMLHWQPEGYPWKAT